jgi:AcrR family transcriptional regulator
LSRALADTRTRILDTARRLLEERGYYGVGVDEIAKSAGVSRQAVYLHFGSKAKLLLATARHIDATGELAKHLEYVFAAPDALTALDRAVDLHVAYDTKILRFALLFESARRTEKDADVVWQDRQKARLSFFRRLVEWLKRDGVLAPDLTVAQAADIWWTLQSHQVLEQLTVQRDWSKERYGRGLKRLLRRALTTGSDEAG